MSDVSVSITGGGTLETVEIRVEDALPTKADLLYALERQKARILARTERGLDVDGKPFAPYNRTRPYYWYPAGRVGKKRSADAVRKEKNNVTRAAKKSGGKVSRSGLGVRFDSYDAFKRTGLGRSNPDLRGPRAPHMLQAIDIKTGGGEDSLEGRIGIYGDEAARATGHNAAAGRPKGMPRRQFIGASDQDAKDFAGDISSRAGERMTRRR